MRYYKIKNMSIKENERLLQYLDCPICNNAIRIIGMYKK